MDFQPIPAFSSAQASSLNLDLESYLLQCYDHLKVIMPILLHHHGMIDQQDLDIRLQMWKTCQSLDGLSHGNSDIDQLILASQKYLKIQCPEALHGHDAIHATLEQDLAEMSRSLNHLIIRTDDGPNQLLKFTEEKLFCAMNVIQTIIDGKYENYGPLQKIFLRIVRKNHVLPPYLYLSDVRLLNNYPVHGAGFADVYKGLYLDHTVALKVLRVGGHGEAPSSEESGLPGTGEQDGVDFTTKHKLFCNEAMNWRQFNHSNILPFYGVAAELFPPRMCMVSPWMENGDLVTYLKKHDHADRRSIIIGIAEGLNYLHLFGNGVVHGDLRGANILINREGVPRIADFGLTQIVIGHYSSRLHSSSAKAGGNIHWIAPEILGYDPDNDPKYLGCATKESDVYAFSCVCMEVFTGQPPFGGLLPTVVLRKILINKETARRPSAPQCMQRGLDDHMWNIMQSCWNREPGARPSMSEVLESLRDQM